MTTFWSWYISLLTIFTLLALTWLIFATRRGESKGTTDQTMAPQMIQRKRRSRASMSGGIGTSSRRLLGRGPLPA